MEIKNINLVPSDWSNQSHSVRITDPTATSKDYASFFSKMANFSYLHIYNPKIEELPEQALNNFPNLKSINLECSNLKNLPAKWFEGSLTQVIIKCPKVTAIPDEIWQNSTLQTLQLLNLGLREISEFEPQLGHLYNFKLTASSLERLPESIRKLNPQIMELCAPQLKGFGDVLNHYPRLVSLILEAPTLGFYGNLNANKQLRSLRLKNIRSTQCGILEQLPESLQDLTLIGKPACWRDELNLSKLPQLKRLNISYYQGGTFPESIGDCSALEELYMDHCTIPDMSEALLKCQKLGRLIIRSGTANAFPNIVARHPGLKQVHIYNVPFKEIPQDWSGATSLESLSINRSQLHFKDLSFIETMPAIKKIDLFGNSLASLDNLLIKKGVHLALTPPEGLQFKNFQDFRKLCAAIAKTDLPEGNKRWFVGYLAARKDIKTLDDLAWNPLLQATNINFGPFRKKVLSLIHKKIDQQTPDLVLKPNTTIYISGKTKLTKTEIRKMCSELDLKISLQLEPSVTHVLLGTNCKDYDQLPEGEYIYLTENHLQDYYSTERPQFLEQAEQAADENSLVKNVSALLQSADAANVLLGLEMLKTGGVPKGLVEDLIVIQKTTADSKVRGRVKKLLELHAPQEWLLVIRDTLSFKNIGNKARESDLHQQLKKLADRSSSEMAGRLSILLYKHYQRGLRYALLSKVPEAVKVAAIQHLFDGTHFDYSKGIGYKNWKNTAPGSVLMYSAFGTNAPLPVNALALGKIENLNLHNCKYETIRREIVAFKDLQKLDLSNNWIKVIPAYFLQLENLTELDLSFNIFPAFPIKLKKLKNLRRLDLRHNRSRTGYEPLVVPDEFREALPDCEVLV